MSRMIRIFADVETDATDEELEQLAKFISHDLIPELGCAYDYGFDEVEDCKLNINKI